MTEIIRRQAEAASLDMLTERIALAVRAIPTVEPRMVDTVMSLIGQLRARFAATMTETARELGEYERASVREWGYDDDDDMDTDGLPDGLRIESEQRDFREVIA